jgi:hypothetical protein
MKYTEEFAKQELDIILSSTVRNSIIEPLAKEILAFCKAFGESGQAGGAAGDYRASVIAQTIKDLCQHKPISDITGHEREWEDKNGRGLLMNKRCNGLFKKSDGKCDYINAIAFIDKNGDRIYSPVYIDNKEFELIGERQYVRFPFKPKNFLVDVVRVPVCFHEAKRKKVFFHTERGIRFYYFMVKDTRQLDEVFKYYDKKSFL